MRELQNRRELDEIDEIKDAQRGYILNHRPEVKRLHRVTCVNVAVMWTNPHPKFFFAEFEEASSGRMHGMESFPPAGPHAVTAIRGQLNGQTETEPVPDFLKISPRTNGERIEPARMS
ncbi:MAG: hypothetical protein ABSD51_00270 [Candidatus Binatus sp.]|jgi:hypothetical protein